MTREEIEALLADDDGSRISVDEDSDAYLLPDGLPNNLLALPACDDDGRVQNTLQWQFMVERYNAAPDIARFALAADTARLEAEAQVAAVVERRAEEAIIEKLGQDTHGFASIADVSWAIQQRLAVWRGEVADALLDGLRARTEKSEAERDEAIGERTMARAGREIAIAERDAALAQLAEAHAREAGLRKALSDLVEAVENWAAAENVAPPEWPDTEIEAAMIGATYAGQSVLASPAPKGETT